MVVGHWTGPGTAQSPGDGIKICRENGVRNNVTNKRRHGNVKVGDGKRCDMDVKFGWLIVTINQILRGQVKKRRLDHPAFKWHVTEVLVCLLVSMLHTFLSS